MKLPVYNKDGSKSAETVEIPDTLLAGEPNDHAIWLAVRSEMSNRHQGTHKTKSRSFVSGGGRKPFPQKGRGVARQGSTRSPLNPGGGTIFGPMPHKYSTPIPAKVKKLARRSALIYKARTDKIRVVEDFSLSAPKTREMFNLFIALGLAQEKVLFLTPEFDLIISKSVSNLPRANSQKAESASTRDLMDCTTIVMQKSAVPKLVKVLEHAA
jgi:large subunit ribosomal protein L4